MRKERKDSIFWWSIIIFRQARNCTDSVIKTSRLVIFIILKIYTITPNLHHFMQSSVVASNSTKRLPQKFAFVEVFFLLLREQLRIFLGWILRHSFAGFLLILLQHYLRRKRFHHFDHTYHHLRMYVSWLAAPLPAGGKAVFSGKKALFSGKICAEIFSCCFALDKIFRSGLTFSISSGLYRRQFPRLSFFACFICAEKDIRSSSERRRSILPDAFSF